MHRLLTPLKLLSIAVVVLMAAFCMNRSTSLAQDATPTATPAGNDANYTAEEVKFGVALGKAHGHLVAALANWQAADYGLAAAHVGHTKAELATVNSDLKDAKADTALNTSVDAFAAFAALAGDKTAVQQAQKDAIDAIDQAGKTVLGDLYEDQQYRGSVISELVHTVEHEYDEALQDGKIALKVEYQDARGFLLVAQDMWTTLKTDDIKDDPANVEQIDSNFELLGEMFPNFITLPEAPATTQGVENAVDAIRDGLSKLLELPVFEAPSSGTDMVIHTIEMNLDDSLTDYKAGRADDAYEKAASAYLDGFENLEPDLLKLDKDLVSTVETQMKALRDGYKSGQPAADMEALIKTIKGNLEKAGTLLAK